LCDEVRRGRACLLQHRKAPLLSRLARFSFNCSEWLFLLMGAGPLAAYLTVVECQAGVVSKAEMYRDGPFCGGGGGRKVSTRSCQSACYTGKGIGV